MVDIVVNYQVMLLCIESSPDYLGRQHFSLEWFQTSPQSKEHLPVEEKVYRRGQHFFAHVNEHVDRLQKKGYYVHIIHEYERETI